MSKVKNQHYVPRSYLKYFSNKKQQVWVYDKKDDKMFSTNIINVASERYFYDIPFDEIYKVLQPIERDKVMKILQEGNFSSSDEMKQSVEQSVEKFFSDNIETPFKQLLDNIRTRYTLMQSPLLNQAFSNEERLMLSFLISYQIVRSKEFRQSYFETKEAYTQSIVDMLAKQIDKYYKPGSFKAVPKHEFQSLEHAHVIFGEIPLRLAEILSSHFWFIGVNMTNIPSMLPTIR